MSSATLFPRAILHLDADAFFASCEQALHPEYKGKPVVVGADRGIATSFSYPAKRRGVKRGMTIGEIKRVAPETIILPGDYESYSLFSKRIFAIMRRFSSEVEEYSIDEGFMDITGATGPGGMKYEKIAETIKHTVERELNITVSVGLAPTKVLAKLASSWNKPDGLSWISRQDLPEYLRDFPVEAVWGIGHNTAEYMRGLSIFTAYDLAVRSAAFVQEHFAKPHQEIWRELNGASVYPVIAEAKTEYASISKTGTFTPTNERETIYAELVKNIENACRKARAYNLAARRVTIFIKTQAFKITALEAELNRASGYPEDIIRVIKPLFERLYLPGVDYRTTGVVLAGLHEADPIQGSLFELPLRLCRYKTIYRAIDALTAKFGRPTVHLGSSLPARTGTRELSRLKSGHTRLGLLTLN